MRVQVQDLIQDYTADATAKHEAEETMRALLTRAATDRPFRQRLVTEPRVAIAEFRGCDVSAVPSSFNIAFIENRPGTSTVVLPNAIDPAAELSDAELASVAGGSETLEWALASALLVSAVGHLVKALI